MSTDRRTFVKRVAGATGAAAAAALVPGPALGAELGRCLGQLGLRWEKAPCRFCDVGCGLRIGLEGGRAVAVRGDPDSPVNRGLACAKGYHSVQALYARDRLTRAGLRRGGRLVEVPMEEALDVVARTLRETVDAHGKDSIAMYGSGAWSIPAGYAAAKLFKGALGSNNVETEARLEIGSAMAGALATFGLDGAIGCYEDIDHADVFVVWGANMAETHPVLFSRMLEQRQSRPGVRIVDLATRTTRTSYAADRSLLFVPQSDLAIANGIAHEILARGRANRTFLDRYVAFKQGRTGIGRPADDGLEDDVADAGFDDYVRFLADYTPEKVERLSGMAASDIRWLASLYADPSLRVMSLWGTGANRHGRGTWMNNLLYDIHLLVGKVGAPGNSPFPLGAGASGWGTAREAGALAEGLPGGTVTRAEDRERAAAIWGVPAARIDARPGHRGVALFDALDRGDIRFLWIQGADPLVTLPNLHRYRAAAEKDRFLVVSDGYPTATTDVADVVLPGALWIEEEGLFGSAERRTQHFEALVRPPGEAMGMAWQTLEVARRLGFGALFPWDQATHIEGIWAEYSRFRADDGHRLAPLAELKRRPGVLWPYVEGRETMRRYAAAHDPAADPARGEFDFYGHPDHRAWIWIRPYEPPAEIPDAEYPLWLTTGAVLEHEGSGTLTRRIPTLHRAVPRAYVEVNRRDAEALGVRDGDPVRLVSRRGSLTLEARIDLRAQPPRGHVFVPSFDGSRPVNVLTLDAGCPLSGQPGYTCAVRLERIGEAARP